MNWRREKPFVKSIMAPPIWLQAGLDEPA